MTFFPFLSFCFVCVAVFSYNHSLPYLSFPQLSIHPHSFSFHHQSAALECFITRRQIHLLCNRVPGLDCTDAGAQGPPAPPTLTVDIPAVPSASRCFPFLFFSDFLKATSRKLTAVNEVLFSNGAHLIQP